MTWGQYSFPFIPMVDRYKWLETRYMVNISDRWATDHTHDLQFAFFNGIGTGATAEAEALTAASSAQHL